MNTNTENKDINATPHHGVIPFPSSDNLSSPVVNVVPIEFGDTVSSVDIDSTFSYDQDMDSDPAWAFEHDVIVNIRRKHHLIVGYDKKMANWKKLKLETAIEIGGHLDHLFISNRFNYPTYKKLWSRFFADYFCYKTARRYLALFWRKDQLPPEVCSTRQAYLSLGIIKESDTNIEKLYGDDDSLEASNSSPSGLSNSSNGCISKKQSTSIKKLQTQHADSLLTTLNHQGEAHCVAFRFKDQELCVNIIGSDCPISLTEDSEQLLLEKLKPFVEWYNMAVIDYQNSQTTSSSTNDLSELKLAA